MADSTSGDRAIGFLNYLFVYNENLKNKIFIELIYKVLLGIL